MSQKWGKPWGSPVHMAGGQLFEFFPNIEGFNGFGGDGDHHYFNLGEQWFKRSDMGKWLKREKATYRFLTNRDDDFLVLIEDNNVAMRFKLTFVGVDRQEAVAA